MMTLLFVSGISFVLSTEEEVKRVKQIIKENFSSDLAKKALEKSIEANSKGPNAITPKTDDDDDLFHYDDEASFNAGCTANPYFCTMYMPPWDLISLDLTITGGVPPAETYSMLVSETFLSHIVFASNDDDDDISLYTGAPYYYWCTGNMNSADLYGTQTSCSVSKQSALKGEWYYFLFIPTSPSVDYEVKIWSPLSNGAIAGITIGVILVVLCCCGGVAFCIMNNRKKQPQQPQTQIITLAPGQVQQNPTLQQSPTVITTNAV